MKSRTKRRSVRKSVAGRVKVSRRSSPKREYVIKKRYHGFFSNVASYAADQASQSAKSLTKSVGLGGGRIDAAISSAAAAAQKTAKAVL